MNPAAGSAEEVVAAAIGLCGESVKVLLRVPIDPLSLLGNRLAPELAGLLERRSHYLGQIEGMAALHAGETRGRARKTYVHRMDQLHRKETDAAGGGAER
jgi:hypothetical protein